MKRTIRTILLGAAACLTAAAVALPLNLFYAQAAGFVNWKDAGEQDGKNAVEISVRLREEEIFEESATFQVGFLLKQADGTALKEEDCDFQFSQGIKGNPKVVVSDCRYMGEGEMRILVSSRKAPDGSGGILNKESALTLGKLYVESEQDVTVTLIEEQCKAVDERGNLTEINWLGEEKQYTFQAGNDPGTTPSEPGSSEEDPGNNDDPSKPDPENPSTGDNNNGGNLIGGSSGGSGNRVRRSSSGGESIEDYIESSTGPGLAVEAKGDWEAVSGGLWKFRFENGTYARNEWIYVKGLWYRLGNDEIMITGWFQDNGLWYYLKPDSGYMTTDWRFVNDHWYYMGTNGIMRSQGWRQIDGKWYYLNPVVPVPRQTTDPVTGAVIMTTEGQLPQGAMYANTTTPDGYHVDANGVWIP